MSTKLARETEPELPFEIAARRAAAAAFRSYWTTIAERLEQGDLLFKERHDSFFALDEHEQYRLARAFYTATRAREFAALLDSSVADQLSVWLDQAIDVSEDESLSPIERLVRGEYVILVLRGGYVSYVTPYPGDVLYDDIYELTASGISSGGQVLIYKSTGEPFDDEEFALAEPAIVQHVESNAASDDERVSVSVYRQDEYAIMVYVSVDYEDERDEDEHDEDGDHADAGTR